MIQLRVAKVHPVDNFKACQIYGYATQNQFYDLLNMFDVSVSTTDEYAEEYEALREDIEKMAGDIAYQGKTYRANEDEIQRYLSDWNMDADELVEELMHICKESDQSNEWVLLSWF